MGFLSKITKPFKKIAKRIKKTASSVWKGVQSGVLKPLGKLYGKTFGKLGPLGMVAASLILPGIGSMISAGWTSMAGALGQAGAGSFLNAVSTGMNAISTGLSTVSTGISDTLNAVMDKGKDLFGQAQSWVTGGGDPAKFAAKQVSQSTSSLLQANPELVGASNAQARNQFAAITDAQKSRALLGPEATNLSFNATQQQQIAEQFAQTPGLAKKTLLQTTGETLATPQVLAKDINVATQGRAAGAGKQSFAKKAAKGIASSLLAQGAAPIEVPIASLASTDFSAFGSNRLGIGGQGSVGGQFLNQQQQAFFQQHAQLLGREG